jgi:hypothetical protein
MTGKLAVVCFDDELDAGALANLRVPFTMATDLLQAFLHVDQTVS